MYGRKTLKKTNVCFSFMHFFIQLVNYIFVGSILSAGGSGPFDDNALKALSSDWADMVDGFQKSALESRLGIPLIYGIDAVHGNNNIYGATIFPHNVGLGSTRLVLNSFLSLPILHYFSLFSKTNTHTRKLKGLVTQWHCVVLSMWRT